jgi:hypothetical protein
MNELKRIFFVSLYLLFEIPPDITGLELETRIFLVLYTYDPDYGKGKRKS